MHNLQELALINKLKITVKYRLAPVLKIVFSMCHFIYLCVDKRINVHCDCKFILFFFSNLINVSDCSQFK